MTKFDKAAFDYHGGYLTYQGKFVARFKYSSRDKVGFQAFLIKNFSVEEYFEALGNNGAPALILETKGYVSKTVKNLLRQVGYPETQEGHKAYIAFRVNETRKRLAA